MKKEIMELLEMEEGMYRINGVASLYRWKKDGLGNEVDRLEVKFDNINNIRFGIYDTEIKARNFNGIIKEAQEIIGEFFKDVSERFQKDLNAGYRRIGGRLDAK